MQCPRALWKNDEVEAARKQKQDLIKVKRQARIAKEKPKLVQMKEASSQTEVTLPHRVAAYWAAVPWYASLPAPSRALEFWSLGTAAEAVMVQ